MQMQTPANKGPLIVFVGLVALLLLMCISYWSLSVKYADVVAMVSDTEYSYKILQEKLVQTDQRESSMKATMEQLEQDKNTMNADLKAQIGLCEENLDSMRNGQKNLEMERNELSETIKSIRDEYQTLYNQENENKIQIEQLSRERDSLNSKIQILTSELENSKNQIIETNLNNNEESEKNFEDNINKDENADIENNVDDNNLDNDGNVDLGAKVDDNLENNGDGNLENDEEVDLDNAIYEDEDLDDGEEVEEDDVDAVNIDEDLDQMIDEVKNIYDDNEGENKILIY